MNDYSRSIRNVLVVFLFLFVALISYFSYFVLVEGPKVVNRPTNKRLWVKRNEVLRGTIFDRNMKPLTKSEKIDQVSQKREYLGGELFAHVLGYVNPTYGITGLENKYDNELMYDDSVSYFDMLLKKKTNDNKVGHGLKVTVDYDIQKAAYDALGNYKGAVVVLNPKTGEILAMVSKPSFDPNNLENIWKSINDKNNKDRPLLNRAVSGLYPPGSSFKMITCISSLENIQGVTNTTFNDNGKLYFNSKYSLSNFGGEVLGNLNLKQAFAESSNVVFGGLAVKLGNDKLKATAEKFYFNKDIPADGIVIDDSKFPTIPKTEQGSIAQSGIGQASVLASPMEMAIVASTIANDGVMMEPRLVSDILSNDGSKQIKSVSSKAVANIISKDTAKTLKDYMREVVVSGTGRAAAVSGINVCGKTGTADHAESSTPHSWFVGFAPYEDPQIAFAVIAEDGGQGGVTAAKVASTVIKTALKR